MSGERSTVAMLIDHIPRYPCSWYVIQLNDRIVHVFEEFMLEAGATKLRGMTCGWRSAVFGRELLEIDLGMWFWLVDGMAPHRHLFVDVPVTSARTNINVHRLWARLPLPGSLAVGGQHGKLDADLRTSPLLDTPSVESVHDYYPFALEDGGGWRLWRLS
jgi:hypothetical protein